MKGAGAWKTRIISNGRVFAEGGRGLFLIPFLSKVKMGSGVKVR